MVMCSTGREGRRRTENSGGIERERERCKETRVVTEIIIIIIIILVDHEIIIDSLDEIVCPVVVLRWADRDLFLLEREPGCQPELRLDHPTQIAERDVRPKRHFSQEIPILMCTDIHLDGRQAP